MKILIVLAFIVVAIALVAWSRRRSSGPDYSRRFAPVPGAPQFGPGKREPATGETPYPIWMGTSSDLGAHTGAHHAGHCDTGSTGGHCGADGGSN